MLQKMQEQTARLHEQYLHGQEAAQQTIHQLIEQQMRLLAGASGIAIPPAAVTAPKWVPTPNAATIGVEHRAAAHYYDEPRANVTANGAQIQSEPASAKTSQSGPPPTGHGTPADDRTQLVLLEVIAEKTGYPVEMLELDMTLDADLGIDSIKRVEILSALQTRLPQAPVVKPEDLGRLQTLRQIVLFLSDGIGTTTPANGTDHPAAAAALHR